MPLPSVTVTFGIGYNTTYGYVFQDEKPDTADEIARLERALCGDAEDSNRYYRLAHLYAGEDKKKEAGAKALEIAKRYYERDPQNGRHAMFLGNALDANNDQGRAERSKLLRRAVELAPRDPECWMSLGDYLQSEAIWSLMNGKIGGIEMVLRVALQTPIPEAQFARCRQFSDQAYQCYDNAVRVAPTQPKPYARRAGSRFIVRLFEGILRASSGQGKDAAGIMASMFSLEQLPDLRKAAEVDPDDPRATGILVFFELMSHVVSGNVDKPGKGTVLSLLPEASQKSILSSVSRLEGLTKHRDRKIAGDAHYLLGLFDVLAQQDLPSAEVNLRRAIDLRPEHDGSWDLLAGVLYNAKKSAENVAIHEEWLRVKDNTANRFGAGKACILHGKLDDAQRHLLAGLKKEPVDVACNLALAAVLVRRGDKVSLEQAGQRLDAADAAIAKDLKSPHADVALVARSVYLALTGNPDVARTRLREFLGENKDDENAKAALAALGG